MQSRNRLEQIRKNTFLGQRKFQFFSKVDDYEANDYTTQFNVSTKHSNLFEYKEVEKFERTQSVDGEEILRREVVL